MAMMHSFLINRYLICTGNAQVLFAATYYFDTGKDAQIKAMGVLTKAFFDWTNFLANFISFIEACMGYDLILTLTNPFANGQPRTKKWLAGSTFLSVIAVVL